MLRESSKLQARSATIFREGELVKIEQVQFGRRRKNAAEFLGPNKVMNVRPHDRYDLVKIDGDGPKGTSTAALHVQPYQWLCFSGDPPGRMDLSRKGRVKWGRAKKCARATEGARKGKEERECARTN